MIQRSSVQFLSSTILLFNDSDRLWQILRACHGIQWNLWESIGTLFHGFCQTNFSGIWQNSWESVDTMELDLLLYKSVSWFPSLANSRGVYWSPAESAEFQQNSMESVEECKALKRSMKQGCYDIQTSQTKDGQTEDTRFLPIWKRRFSMAWQPELEDGLSFQKTHPKEKDSSK